MVTRPELPGTQLARTTSATNLANGANSPTVVTSVTVPAGSWGIYIDPSAVVLAEPTGALS